MSWVVVVVAVVVDDDDGVNLIGVFAVVVAAVFVFGINLLMIRSKKEVIYLFNFNISKRK